MKKLSVIALVSLSIAFAAYAEAATPKKRTRNANRIGPYGGALVGYSDYSNDQTASEERLIEILLDQNAPIQGDLTSSTENTDIGYQAMFGYRFHRFFAAELGLAQFGSVESTARGDLDFGNGFVPTSVKFSFSAGGPILSAIGILPLNDKFELFARLGYMFTSAEREFSARVDGDTAAAGALKGDSQDPVYGVGFAWNINQVYSIRGEFQKLDSLGDANNTGEEDLTVIGLGLTIRFKEGLLMKGVCILLAVMVTACGGTDASIASTTPGAVRIGNAFVATPVAEFQEPWAMTFLPDGRLLVTEKKGALKLLDIGSKRVGNVSGVPQVAYGGQGGFGDVVLHPQFAANSIVYVSYSEPGDADTNGAAVARARLEFDRDGGGSLQDLKVIWRQVPKVSSGGHWGHRLAFGLDGMLWITSSERQQFTPAQDMKSNLGKVVRLKDDGSVPADNPFYAQGGVTAQIWSLGHRNLLGIAFAPDGRLYTHEMGPAGGDELNVIERGANYGYPIVSNGNHYNGADIPDHSTRPEFRAPLITWNPVISPAGFIIYSGKMFPDWTGDGFIGGLSSESLVRVEFGNGTAREAQRFDMGRRIREVEQGPDGAIWLLEDQRNLTGGRLLKLTP